MPISTEDLFKIFVLINSDYEGNQKVGVRLLETFGILEEVLKSLVYRLAAVPFNAKGKAYSKVLQWAQCIALHQSNEEAKIKKYLSDYDFSNAHQDWKLDISKIQFRSRGGNRNYIFQEGSESDQLELAQFVLSHCKTIGKGLEMYPIAEKILLNLDLDGLHELWLNSNRMEHFPIEKALNSKIEVINISDFPKVNLSDEVLSRLSNRTLKMRRGFYYRHQEKFDAFPKIKIEFEDIGIQYFMRNTAYRSSMSTESIAEEVVIDRSIIKGKYLSSVLRCWTTLLPDSLKQVKNLELLYIPVSRLKSIPYRLMRFKKLQYVVLASRKKRPRVRVGLENHPSLKAIFFLHIKSTIGLDYRRLNKAEFQQFEVLDLKKVPKSAIKKGYKYLEDDELWQPVGEEFQFVIEEVERLQNYVGGRRQGMSLEILLNNFEKPAPVFEEVTNENDLFSVSLFEDLLAHFDAGDFILKKEERIRPPQDINNIFVDDDDLPF